MMIAFSSRGLLDSVRRLWRPYRRAQDAETLAAIRWLVQNPEAPCTIEGVLVPNGHGREGVNDGPT